MIQLFDKNNIYEIPNFTLCNPDSTEIAAISAYNKRGILRYNDVSEITLDIPEKYTADGESNIFPYFDDIEIRRLILIDNLGYFQIAEVTDSSDGTIRVKSVLARSLQYELSAKSIDYLNGTYKFYDATSNYDDDENPTTLMGYILQYAVGWSIGTIDPALFNKYRTLDISERTVLDFLYSDVEEAYQCIFEFDFLNKTISAKSIDSLLANPYNTDIYLSFDNLLQNVNIIEQSDEIRTKLYVYGQDLDIRQVNPLGTAYIINVDYYMNTRWMTQDLITAISIWKEKIANYMSDSSSTSYASLLVDLNDAQSELTALESTMTTLEGELKSLENIMSVRIQQGIDYSDVLSDINNKTSEINQQQTLIDAKNSEIESLKNSLSIINNDCKLKNNFTSEQLIQLDKYLIEDTYTNDNYIVTDLMTSSDIQAYAQELYDEAQNILARLSQPRYTFSLTAANFIFLKDFQQFTTQLLPGRIINIENSDGEILCPILLEMDYSWDDPSDFTLEFGNRFRLSDNTYTYEELIGAASSTSGQVANNWDAIISFSKNYKSEVNNLINNAFNVALKEIISSANQEMVWDSSGMTFRKWVQENGSYENEQIKIINNKIVFTDDAWNSLKTVIGKIVLTGGGTAYGIVAEAIVGRLLTGVNLIITNANNTFTIDENGFSFIIPSSDPNTSDTTIGLSDYINNQISELETTTQELIDGKIASYYQDTLPHNQYFNIADNDIYNKYIGDLWFNTGYNEGNISANKTYIYQKLQSGDLFNYIWKEIEAVPDLLYDIVDTKKTVFISTSDTYVPAPPYSIGDLWSQGSYQNGEIMVCNTARDTGEYNASDWVESNKYTSNLATFINDTFEPSILNIEGLIDSRVDTYYQSTAPSDYIISQLSDDNSQYKLALARLGDIWYDTVNKIAKVYSCSPSSGSPRTFMWTIDNSIPTDLFDTIDEKKTVFVSSSDEYTPIPPYNLGDLWAQNEYSNGELLVCVRAKNRGSIYEGIDWIKSSSYSQVLNDFIQTTYIPEINSKIETYYQNILPHDEYRGINSNADHDAFIGDIWYNTGYIDTINGITANKTYRYCKEPYLNQYNYIWKEINAVPDSLYDTVDTKKAVFVSTSDSFFPNPPYNIGDLWVQGDYQNGDLMVCTVQKSQNDTYNTSDWSKASKYTDDSSLTTFINGAYVQKIAELEGAIDGMVVSFYQATAPSTHHIGEINRDTQQSVFDDAIEKLGDIWYDTINKQAMIYSCSPETGNIRTFSWEIDNTIPTGLYNALNGKKTIYLSTSENYTPSTPYYKGDLWAQGLYQDKKLLISQNDNYGNYNENDWISASSELDTFISNVYTPQIDGKISSYYQSDIPYSNQSNISVSDNDYALYNSRVGDIWYDTINNKSFMYTKTANEDNYDYIWQETDGVNSDLFDVLDGKSQIFLGFTENLLTYNYNNLSSIDVLDIASMDSTDIGNLDATTTSKFIKAKIDLEKNMLIYDSNYYTVCIPCIADSDYQIIKKTNSNIFIVGNCDTENIIYDVAISGIMNCGTNDAVLFKTSNSAQYICITYYNSLFETYDENDVLDSIQVRKRVIPSPPYEVGDMWVQGDNGDIYICITARADNEQYNESDWNKASKYTDDSGLNTFINEKYVTDIDEIRGLIDNKVDIYYQDFEPIGLEGKDIGDLWYSSTAGQLKRWNGISWDLIQDEEIINAIAAAQNTADGKITTYYLTKSAADTLALAFDSKNNGDILYASDEGNKVYRYSWNVNTGSGSWVDVQDVGISVDLANVLSELNLISDITDGEVNIYYIDSEPTNMTLINIGDLWYNTTTKILKRLTAVSPVNIWENISNSEVIRAISSLQVSTDKKITSYYISKSEAVVLSATFNITNDGDILFATDEGNKIYRFDWDSNTSTGIWTSVQDGDLLNIVGELGLLSNIIDGEVNIYYSKTEPVELTSGNIGDLWYNTDNKILKRLAEVSGDTYTWTIINDSEIIRAIAAAQDTADGKITTYYLTKNAADVMSATFSYKNDGDLLYATDEGNAVYRYTWNGDSGSWINVQDTGATGKLAEILSDLRDMGTLVDSKITSFYQEILPHNEYVNISTDNINYLLYNSYVGDIWYNTNNSKSYIYNKLNNETTSTNYDYLWKEIEAVPDSLYDKIDTKRQIFYSEIAGYVPSPPYEIGDMWVQGINGDIMICAVNKTLTTDIYNVNDWQISSKYTDDSAINDFINNAYSNDMTALEGLIDSKIDTYYQSIAPLDYVTGLLNRSGNETIFALAVSRLNDIWYDTNDKVAKVYSCDPTIGTERTFSWIINNSIPTDLFDAIDSKKAVFISTSDTYVPIPPYAIGDMWAQGSYQQGEILICKTARTSGDYISSDWIISNKYNENLTDFVSNIYQPAIDSKITSYYSVTSPHTENVNITVNSTYYITYCSWAGDIWYRTDIQKQYMYVKKSNADNPSNYDFIWQEIDGVPSEVYDKIDEKRQIFVSTSDNYTPNPPYEIGDLWSQNEYANGELMVCVIAKTQSTDIYSADDWKISNTYAADAQQKLQDFIENTYQPTVDSKIDYYWQTEAPHAEYINIASSLYDKWIGDTWYDTSNDKTCIYTKIAGETQGYYNYSWVELMTEIPQELYDEIDGKKSVYTKRPNSFKTNDIWVYEGSYNSITNPTSDLNDNSVPNSGYYQAPYVQGTTYTYFKQDDLLIATADSNSYNPSIWKKYSENITKSNNIFEFILNNDGVTITNGNLVMTRNDLISKILLDPDNGIRIQKNIGTTNIPEWEDRFYADADGNINLTGSIISSSGNIAGWTINNDMLSYDCVGLYSGATSSSEEGTYQYQSLISGYNTIRIWAGNATPNSAKFKVLNDGSFYASAASISGKVICNSGEIGGWSIKSDGLSNSNGEFYLNSDGTGKIGLMTFTSSSAIFRGNIYADNLITGQTTVDGQTIDVGYIGNAQIADNSISPDKLYSEYTDGVTQSIAAVQTYADSTFATTVSVSSMRQEIEDEFGNYVTISSLNASIGTYIDSEDGTSKIILSCSGTYQTQSGMSAYSTTEQMNSSITQSIDNEIAMLTLSTSSSTANNQTTNTITLKSGTTSLGSSITISATTATQAATIAADTVNGITLSVSTSTLSNQTTSTITMKNGTTTITSAVVIGTTAAQAATIAADTVNGITLSVSTTTASDQTTSTITMKNGTTTISSAAVVATTAAQAATIAASAVNGITLSVTNGTESSTLTLKNGTTTITSGTIQFTGVVTFSDLSTSSTSTIINGDNIRTGTISADRIDADSISIKYLFTSDGKLAVYGLSSYLYLGASSGSVSGYTWASFSMIHLTATNYIYFAPSGSSSLYFTMNTSDYSFYHTSSSCKLGTSTYPWDEVHVTDLYIGSATLPFNPNDLKPIKLYAGSSSSSYYVELTSSRELIPSIGSTSYPFYLGTSAKPWSYAYIGNILASIGAGGGKIGFFGATPIYRKSVSDTATVETLIAALKDYGLIY